MSLNIGPITHNGSQALYAAAGSGGGGGGSTFASASISSLTVSTINGEAQWISTFGAVPLPANSSTVIGQIPGNGAFNYNLTSLSTAQAWGNVGMGSQAFVNPAYFGALGATVPSGASTDSPLVPFLSTPQTSGPIWIGVANPTAGDCSLAALTVASTAA